MGRPKLILKRIPNTRERNFAFMKRKKELIKKVSDFSTICKADACLIIYDSNGNTPPETWPQDTTKVKSFIEKYELARNERPPKMFGLNEFYAIKKKHVEAEISKVRKNALKIQCPTWHPSLNTLGEEQMKNLIAILQTKLEACNQRIYMLKQKQQMEDNLRFLRKYQSQLHNGNQVAPYPYNVDITSHQVDVPYLDCTNQISDLGNSTNRFDVLQDWTSDQLTAMMGASNYDTNFHALQKDGNEDMPDSSLCNYNGVVQPMQPCNSNPAMQNIDASQFQNVDQAAASIQPPLGEEFNTHDYNDILQAQLFNLIN